MNIKILKALAVLKSVLAFYAKNQERLDAKGDLKRKFEELKQVLIFIEFQLPKKYQDHTSLTNLKRQEKERLTSSVLKLDNILYIYHKDKGDKELMKNFKSTKTSLLQRKDLALAIYAQELQTYCKGLSPEKLQEIEIDEAMISALEEHLTGYVSFLPKAKGMINLSVKASEKIVEKIDRSKEIIQDVKCLIYAFFADDKTDLYQDFLVSTKIPVKAARKRAIVGNISADDKGVIKRAHVIIQSENIDQVVTSKKGNFVVNHLPPGVYVVEIVCKNYESQLHTISHVAGETNRLDVKLKRVREVEEVTS
jgi:hypothetical protein